MKDRKPNRLETGGRIWVSRTLMEVKDRRRLFIKTGIIEAISGDSAGNERRGTYILEGHNKEAIGEEKIIESGIGQAGHMNRVVMVWLQLPVRVVAFIGNLINPGNIYFASGRRRNVLDIDL